MGNGILPRSAREIEVFLDAVAMHACQTRPGCSTNAFVGPAAHQGGPEIAREIRGLAQCAVRGDALLVLGAGDGGFERSSPPELLPILMAANSAQ